MAAIDRAARGGVETCGRAPSLKSINPLGGAAAVRLGDRHFNPDAAPDDTAGRNVVAVDRAAVDVVVWRS